VFAAAGILSVAIHAYGAMSTAPHEWNATPVSIDGGPERVWSWRDPQFLRGLYTQQGFVPLTAPLSFFVIQPCRVFDSRGAVGVFGAPGLKGGVERRIPIPEGPCGIPYGA